MISKKQAVANIIELASKQYTTPEIVKQLRLKYTDGYIKEVVQYCTKGNKQAILEIVK
jgi:hypothetical protein